MSGSLRDVLKQRLLDDMINVVCGASTAPKTSCVLVVDPHTTKIISSCLRMYDIMEAGVLVVQNITLGREALPDLPAIYFLQPTRANIDLLIEDFKDAEDPSYRSVHLFFTQHLSKSLLTALGQSRAVKRVKRLIELEVDFLAYESKVFTFQYPCLRELYLPTEPKDLRRTQLKKLTNKVVRKLASVCLTLGEIPFIRFDTTGPNNLFARTVGEMLEMHLKKAVAGLGDAFKQSNRSERSTLLILDRSSDNVTPLMHEFTYQAVLHDMMDIQGEIVTVPDTDKAAEGETKTIVLSEDDKLWNDLRHSHIATVSDTVRDKLRDLMGNSAAAKFTSAKNMTHKELMKVVQERPQFQAMTAMFRKHVELNRLAMATARTDKYLAMGEWEQDLATGKNAENKNVTSSALKAELASICNDPTVTVVEKLRLLMLFTIAHGGLTDAMRTTLMEETSPRISSGLQKAFLNLQHLGVDLHAKKPVAKKKPKNKPKRTFLGLLGITDSAAQELKTGKYGATLRYSPPLKNIASNLMNNKLDPDDFPFVNKADAKHSKSTKNTRFNFRRPTKSKTVKKDMRTRKILFVLGGVTFSELRSAYEVMADPHTEKDNILYIGGNELLTPSSFLEQLSELSPKAFAKQASVSGVSYAAKSTAVHDTDLDGIQLEYSDED